MIGRGGWDDNVPWPCTHVGCYGYLGLQTCRFLRMITFVVTPSCMWKKETLIIWYLFMWLFLRKFKMCKGLDGQEVCHPLRFYSMFLECNNIRARLKPNELSGRSPHSFTVASFDRSFHTACRVSMCEYHQCCGFGWAASFFWWRFRQWPCAIGSAADVVSSSQSIVFGRSFAASERSLATRCDICIHGQDSWLQPFAPVCWFNPELPHPHNLWKMSSAQTCCNVWFPSQKGSTIYTDGNKAINQNNSVQTREWCPWACRQHRDTWGSFSWSSGEKSWMPATVPFLAQRKRREGKPSRNLWAEKPIMIIYERAFVPFGFRRDDKLCYWSPLRSREAAKIASDSVQPAGWVGEYGREVLPLYKGYCCWSQQMGGPGAPSLWRRVRCWGFEDSPYQLESVFMSFTL